MTERSDIDWFFKGAKNLWSPAALILMSAFVGFSALARESGIEIGHAMLITISIWALPSKIILVGAALSGTGLAATFLAVSLASVRFIMMVSALFPELRTKETRTTTMLFLSHFVAVTSYVIAMEKVRDVPREHRIAWFAGTAITLTLANTVLVGVVYQFSTAFPPIVMAVLFFLTPMYFLTSLWASARDDVVKFAMVFGLILGPIFHVVLPDIDLIASGLIGGVLAWAVGYLAQKRKSVA